MEPAAAQARARLTLQPEVTEPVRAEDMEARIPADPVLASEFREEEKYRREDLPKKVLLCT